MTSTKCSPANSFKSLKIFSGLDEVEIGKLTHNFRAKTLSRGEILFEQDSPADHFFVVLSGNLKIVSESHNKKIILTILSAGEIAGALLMTKEASRFPGDIIAINPCEVAVIPKSTYLAHWVAHPQVNQNVVGCVQHRLKHIHEDRSSQQLSAMQRLAIFLLRYFPVGSAPEVGTLRLTRQEIASAIGAKTETVIRAVKRLERLGFINLTQGKISIVKPEELSRIIETKNSTTDVN